MKSILDVLVPLLRTLPAGSRRFLTGYGAASAALALLDVVALGLIAALLPALVGSSDAELPLVGNVAENGMALPILTFICLLIVLKGILAVLLLRFATKRFARHEVAIGDRLFAAYLASPWEKRLGRNSAEIVRSVDVGVGITVSGVLMPAMSLFGELGTLAAVVVVLFVAQPLIAVVTMVYLGLVALLLAKVISPRAVAIGRENREWSNRTAKTLYEALGALKEITLAGRGPEVQEQVHGTRTRSANARAGAIQISQIPRYVLETALVLGFALLGGVGYLTGGPAGAVSAVGLFAVAGFRLIPSLTRMQAVQSSVNTSASFARQIVEDIHEGEAEMSRQRDERPQHELPDRAADIELRDVAFSYPAAAAPALHNVNIRIPAGSHVAFVGASGAGKSTMVDLLLGLLEPSHGHIMVGGEPMEFVLDSWRRRIGYVPQEVSLFDASIAQNVALAWDQARVDPERVSIALRRAQLLDTVMERDAGLDALVGERGMALSGGQRQRLGIARALYDNPRVLVMDEATSALDTTTEAAVTTAIRQLHGDVTVITVAHRLATIRDADIVFFMRGGTVAAAGTFDEVVATVPDFAEQAALAGLGKTEKPVDDRR
ncbi:ATP-binding cassette domain-containing protein [Arthrobacter sp.]|uniref:ABC transporter ATP-binding protein n=1 Tax=Arthrobacter sp. TaxID=1667 RepID=UPI003392A9EB